MVGNREIAVVRAQQLPARGPIFSGIHLVARANQHFGVDASLTPAEVTEVSDFLVKNASNRWTASSSPLRITESAWFKSKHNDREISPAVWKRAEPSRASDRRTIASRSSSMSWFCWRIDGTRACRTSSTVW